MKVPYLLPILVCMVAHASDQSLSQYKTISISSLPKLIDGPVIKAEEEGKGLALLGRQEEWYLFAYSDWFRMGGYSGSGQGRFKCREIEKVCDAEGHEIKEPSISRVVKVDVAKRVIFVVQPDVLEHLKRSKEPPNKSPEATPGSVPPANPSRSSGAPQL